MRTRKTAFLSFKVVLKKDEVTYVPSPRMSGPVPTGRIGRRMDGGCRPRVFKDQVLDHG